MVKARGCPLSASLQIKVCSILWAGSAGLFFYWAGYVGSLKQYGGDRGPGYFVDDNGLVSV